MKVNLRTKVHGFTSWANMRLSIYDHSMNNILMEILTGTNMKYLIQSYTGQKNDKFQSFEGLTREQLATRAKWALKELKDDQILSEEYQLDASMFAIKSSQHIFDFFWHLLCYDISFLYQIISYLANQNEQVLTQVPFNWVPKERPPTIKPKREQSQLSIASFASLAFMDESKQSTEDEIRRKRLDPNERYPGFDLMKGYNNDKNGQNDVFSTLEPKCCVIQMINTQLKTITEGKKINISVSKDFIKIIELTN